MPGLRRTAAVVAGLAGAGVAYAVVETRLFVLREATVPVLPPGARPLKVLHVTDLHLLPGQRRKQEWVRELDRLEPDVVLNTGDTIAHREAVAPVLAALGPLLDRPGAFVLGSNDIFAPRPKNPLRYLLPDSGRRTLGPELPWRELAEGMAAGGWLWLSNRAGRLKAGDLDLELRGIADSHILRDRYADIAGPTDATADLRLGVMHSPEPRNVDAMAADGIDLVLAGHTHGGQLRVPGYGALVTNCGLPRDKARGLSPWGAASYLHVSAGLGTSPYAPVRFACRPEATLLTLVERR